MQQRGGGSSEKLFSGRGLTFALEECQTSLLQPFLVLRVSVEIVQAGRRENRLSVPCIAHLGTNVTCELQRRPPLRPEIENLAVAVSQVKPRPVGHEVVNAEVEQRLL